MTLPNSINYLSTNRCCLSSTSFVTLVMTSLGDDFIDTLLSQSATDFFLPHVIVWKTVVPKLFWNADHLKYLSALRSTKYWFLWGMADHLSSSRVQQWSAEQTFGITGLILRYSFISGNQNVVYLAERQK